MEKLSTNHLRECMAPTMETTSYRLNYMYALLYKVDNDLHNFMDKYVRFLNMILYFMLIFNNQI